ncbi:MAG TPA: alginate export family protein [Pyrinomonadaceae bacterium]
MKEVSVVEPVKAPSATKVAPEDEDEDKSADPAPTRAEFRPPLQQLRYLEDYGYLRDKSLRRERLDRLKYIPLRKDAPDWYLSVGGEIRQRFEAFRNDFWGAAAPDEDGYSLQRYMLHTDWHFGKKIRAFVQLRSNIEAGRSGGPRPVLDENKLDLNQAFVDVNFDAGEKFNINFRAGRQEMLIAATRLVNFREGPNVRLSFDGVRATIKNGKWTFDGFAVKPVESNPGYFDDRSEHQATFWGALGERKLKFAGQSSVGFYYLGLDRKRMRFDSGTGREIRQSVGARLAGNAGAFDYANEFTYQFGEFNGGALRAWMIASDNGYTFLRTRFMPRVGLRANIASGDKNPNDARLETFNGLFSAGNYFGGEIGLLGSSNFMNLHPIINFRLPKRVLLTFDTMLYWRQSTRDGVYNSGGVLLKPGNVSRSRYVGTQPSVTAVWAFDRHITFVTSYTHFFAGKFVNETPPGRDIDFFTAWVTYKF